MRHVLLISLLAAFILSAPAFAAEYTIDRENSIFAVVTHKAGIIARLAHNHLIPAADYDVRLSADDSDLSTCRFEIAFPVENLEVGSQAVHDRWFPALSAAGILEYVLEKTSAKNREKIRLNMLGRKQLDAEQFPTIEAALTDLRAAETDPEAYARTHVATVEMTIHGVTLTREFPARIEVGEGTLLIEAYGPLLFSEFGMKPYSALGGAIRNQDEFFLYVNFAAAKSGE